MKKYKVLSELSLMVYGTYRTIPVGAVILFDGEFEGRTNFYLECGLFAHCYDSLDSLIGFGKVEEYVEETQPS